MHSISSNLIKFYIFDTQHRDKYRKMYMVNLEKINSQFYTFSDPSSEVVADIIS